MNFYVCIHILKKVQNTINTLYAVEDIQKNKTNKFILKMNFSFLQNVFILFSTILL